MFKREFPSLNASPSILGFGLMRLPTKGLLGKLIGGIEKSGERNRAGNFSRNRRAGDCG